ncbi:hypothetical protein [Aliikangiella maris]|uniref:Transposase n=1 Tax=Aliikangiella maris TaxID=3162458 RepID=A0ABV3MVD1_9GAMM
MLKKRGHYVSNRSQENQKKINLIGENRSHLKDSVNGIIKSMSYLTDGNTDSRKLVFLKDGKISIPHDLAPRYGSSWLEHRLFNIIEVLQEMAQRYYDECQLLKSENTRLTRRPERPKLKPSLIASTDTEYQNSRSRRTQIPNPKKSQLDVTQTILLKPPIVPTGARFKG